MSEKTYQFQSVRSLMSVANQPELQADEKPLLTPSVDDADELESFADVEFVDDHKLVYNPHSGTAFDTVTDDYEIINPGQFLGPLCERLNERDRTDVEGTFHARNDGGSVFGHVLFRETESIHLPGRGQSDPVRVGFTLRWSHDSGMSVKAEGFAQDTACTNSMRQITSPLHVKHSGDVGERIDWSHEWDTVLDELGAFSETLANVIEEAMDYQLFDLRHPMREELRDATDPLDTLEDVSTPGPVDESHRDALHGVYELLGFPRYLSTAAADRLMWRLAQKDDPRDVTAWDAYSAATYALTHHARGTPGASDDKYHRIAKDILMNPHGVEDDAMREALAELREGSDQPAAFEPEEIEGDAGEALRAYSERSRELEASFGG